MHEILKPGIALFIITVIAAISLGSAQAITEGPIARQKIITRNAAMQELLPEASDFQEAAEIPKDGGINNYFTAVGANGTIGHIISVAPSGYAGAIDMLVAISGDGTVQGIKIVKQSETPGLGANAAAPQFTDQFKGKSGTLKVTKAQPPADDEIVAITSSTITSRAVVNGVNSALDFWSSNLK